jgi:septal ring factor EnvC (AmiA/AmiB activator)
LKELVYRLLRSYDEQKATQESQQKDLAATIEAQTKTIAKLEATVQGQATKLREVKTLLQADKPSRQSYSDALHRVPSPADSTSTAATLVEKAVPQGTPREQRLNEDKTAITVNTTRHYGDAGHAKPES